MVEKKYSILATMVLIMLSSCIETSRTIDGKDYYEGDQLAVVGYLSNKGAVVSLQSTISPLDKNIKPRKVEGAEVVLKQEGNPGFFVLMEPFNELNYITPETFMPEMGESYYVEVSAPGFDAVSSKSQKVVEDIKISGVNISYRKSTYWIDDAETYYELFGQPRRFEFDPLYSVDNIRNTPGVFTFMNYVIDGRQYSTYGNPIEIPAYYYSCCDESGNHGFMKPFIDHFETEDNFIHNQKEWNEIKNIDGILLIVMTESDDYIDFYASNSEYYNNSSSPFAITARPTLSNMSNNIGYWGYVYVDEMYIELPPGEEGSFVVERDSSQWSLVNGH